MHGRSVCRACAILVYGASWLVVAPAAAIDLSGEWIGEIKPAGMVNGDTTYARFELEQRGAQLSGFMWGAPLSGRINADGQFELERLGQIYSGKLEQDVLVGTTSNDMGPLDFRAYRDTTLAASAQIHVFEPKEFHRLFSGSIAPALRIRSGDIVRTWTVDALGDDANGKRRSASGNPQTGPFYVEGALPGDTLAIHLLKIRTNRATAITSNTLGHYAFEPYYFLQLGEAKLQLVTWNLDATRGVAALANPNDKLKAFSVPLRPFLGCIGVAPPERAAYRTYNLGAYGGNLDYNRLVEGTTVFLPVFQPGALLFVGDGHAAQGDGELAGNALETSLDVELKIELIRGRSARMPRAENTEYLMAMGIAGSLNEALQSATTNLAKWLQEQYALDRYDLSAVLGTTLGYDIAEVVDADYHVVARISKQSLQGISR